MEVACQKGSRRGGVAVSEISNDAGGSKLKCSREAFSSDSSDATLSAPDAVDQHQTAMSRWPSFDHSRPTTSGHVFPTENTSPIAIA